jgi:hypothetical protein
MQSQLTVRLPEELEQEITDAAMRLQLKRSDIVRLSLVQYLRESRDLEQAAPCTLAAGRSKPRQHRSNCLVSCSGSRRSLQRMTSPDVR